jgi:hypothetical protein
MQGKYMLSFNFCVNGYIQVDLDSSDRICVDYSRRASFTPNRKVLWCRYPNRVLMDFFGCG